MGIFQDREPLLPSFPGMDGIMGVHPTVHVDPSGDQKREHGKDRCSKEAVKSAQPVQRKKCAPDHSSQDNAHQRKKAHHVSRLSVASDLWHRDPGKHGKSGDQ